MVVVEIVVVIVIVKVVVVVVVVEVVVVVVVVAMVLEAVAVSTSRRGSRSNNKQWMKVAKDSNYLKASQMKPFNKRGSVCCHGLTTFGITLFFLFPGTYSSFQSIQVIERLGRREEQGVNSSS